MILSSSLLFSLFLKFSFAFASAYFLMAVISYVLRLFQYRKRAKSILQKAHEQSQNDWANTRELLEKEKEENQFQMEQEKEENSFRIQSLKDKMEEEKRDFFESFLQKKETLLERESHLQSKRSGLEERQKALKFKEEEKEKNRDLLIQKLELKLEMSKDEWFSDFKKDFSLEIKLLTERWRKSYEEEIVFNAEIFAKNILFSVLNRFSHPYCSERGLTPIHWAKNLKGKKDKALSALRKDLFPLLEKKCRMEVIYNSKTESFSIGSLDPVSRELGRLVLKKILKEKYLLKKIPSLLKQIPKLIEKTRKDLMQKVKTDGTYITQQLKLDELNENIKEVLGSLRYRYSFTQNQYFHCLEVSFLCGLLSSELNLSLKKGRQAGLLHDIGKAMDHMGEGGHAVIGANFIEKNGVTKDVVHAVKAHHYDEPPKTYLAYLVMTADALSGARPGARHSTLAAFSQKVEQLEKIGNSFKGVKETHVLNAGREVRVFVDSKRVTDLKAVQLSRNIAQEIEEKCIYPGQIKVNVVRRTEAREIAN